MHTRTHQTVSPQTAANATNAQLAQQQALLGANPALGTQLTAAESFSGPVPKTLKGSKRYWRGAFIQLMAMCIEYGAPEFFLTFTANEMGWVDLRRVCVAPRTERGRWRQQHRCDRCYEYPHQRRARRLGGGVRYGRERVRL